MMGVSELSFDKYIMLEILSTNEPFPLRKDGPRAFPPSNPAAKRESGPVERPKGGFGQLPISRLSVGSIRSCSVRLLDSGHARKIP
jgi:hypothetical protein